MKTLHLVIIGLAIAGGIGPAYLFLEKSHKTRNKQVTFLSVLIDSVIMLLGFGIFCFGLID